MSRLSDQFSAFVPTGRAINPISETNWEGTGFEPYIEVPKEQALKVAYIATLKKSMDAAKDENLKNGLKGLVEKVQKELDEMKNVASK